MHSPTGGWVKLMLALTFLGGAQMGLAAQQDAGPIPRYKPYSRAPAPVDIRTNGYGASRNAPNALGIGDTVPDFNVPRSGGGTVSLAEARQSGPVALIFYRGHW